MDDVTEVYTLDDLFNDYRERHIIRPHTQVTYRKVLNVWVKDTGLDTIGDVVEDDVIEWRTLILERASPQTYNNYRAHMRALWNHAKRRGLCVSNPFSEVPPAPVDQVDKKTIPIAALTSIISGLERGIYELHPNWFWILVIKTFYYTGMRRRQLVGLTWGDFDSNRNMLRLSSKTSKTHREWEIPIHEDLGQQLVHLWIATKQELGRDPAGDAQLFNVTQFSPRYSGREMTVEQVSGAFRRLSKSCGFTISAHRLRHTSATLLVNKTRDYKSVQFLLGHTSIKTTLGYVQADIEQVRNAVQALDEVG